MKQLLLGIALASVAALAFADQWPQTTPQTFVSSSGRYRLTVFPLEYEGAMSVHSGLMVQLPAPVRGGAQTACEATLERWVGNSYELVWRKPLVNEISPVSALVSAVDGTFVTFDDWGHTGYGDNVVVIYSGTGDVVKRFALRDIITEKEIEKLPRSIGSVDWGGHHILDFETGNIVELRVGVNDEQNEDKREYRSVRIRMTDGTLVE